MLFIFLLTQFHLSVPLLCLLTSAQEHKVQVGSISSSSNNGLFQMAALGRSSATKCHAPTHPQRTSSHGARWHRCQLFADPSLSLRSTYPSGDHISPRWKETLRRHCHPQRKRGSGKQLYRERLFVMHMYLLSFSEAVLKWEENMAYPYGPNYVLFFKNSNNRLNYLTTGKMLFSN